MGNDVKIFVSYKEKHKILETDIIKPIQTGRAIADEAFEGMIGDNTGDNISSENNKYCELSAQYWVWKHYEEIGNPDYVGFMHYRRHFLFNDNYPKSEKTWLNKSKYYLYENITNEYIQENFQDELIENSINGYDIILCEQFNFSNHFAKTIRENYSKLLGQNVENYDLLMTLVKNMFPEYEAAVEKFKKTKTMWLCNMFIMKKELFFEYNNFLFPMLKKIDELVDSSHFTYNGLRFLGYLSEFLLNIFILHKSLNNNININNLDMAVFNEVSDEEFIEPIYKENFVPIVIPCSNLYAPYLSVWLQSIIDNSSSNNNYDIIVLQDDISIQNQEKLSYMLKDLNNFSLRFYNPGKYLDKSKIKVEKNYLSSVSSYRILIDKFMKGYDKAIISEVDMIFKSDIMDLYKIDIKNYPIAAIIDPHFIRGYNITPNREYYAIEELKLKDKYKYVNTGLMILNITEFSKNNYSDKLVELLSSGTYICLEQDAMNELFNGNIYILDLKWNFLVTDEQREQLVKSMPKDLYDSWIAAKSSYYVIHWCGSRKPWINPDEYYAYKWWEIAKRTPFYEEIIYQKINTNISNSKSTPIQNTEKVIKQFIQNPVDYSLLTSVLFQRKIYLKYWKYKILQNFVFGKKRDEYRAKKYKYKNRCLQVKDFINRYKNAY